MTQCLLIAIGGNLSIANNSLIDDVRHGASWVLRQLRLSSITASSLYSTAPQGGRGRQPRYVNAVIRCRCAAAPAEILRVFKRAERRAGRRAAGINASRPLDIDIIDLGGRVIGWPMHRPNPPPGGRKDQVAPRSNKPRSKNPRPKLGGATRRSPRAWLSLPHPEMHRRRFVLEPLAEVAPHWHHPVLKVAVRTLLARLPRRPGEIKRALDSQWLSCDFGDL
jgi:2-amino-4-hydroxy-6-hydroxymethyldihydropteridine diphosphokinase